MFAVQQILLFFIAFLSVFSAYTGFCNQLERWLLVHRVRTDSHLVPLIQHLDDIGFIRKIGNIDIFLVFSTILMFAASRYAIFAMSTEHPPSFLIERISVLCLLHLILILSINIYLVVKDGEYRLLLRVIASFMEHGGADWEPQTLKLVIFIISVFAEGILSVLITLCVSCMAVINFLDNDDTFQVLRMLEMIYEEEEARRRVEGAEGSYVF